MPSKYRFSNSKGISLVLRSRILSWEELSAIIDKNRGIVNLDLKTQINSTGANKAKGAEWDIRHSAPFALYSVRRKFFYSTTA